MSQDPGNADTPRAHITNMAALGVYRPVISGRICPTRLARNAKHGADCLRDIGIDKDCYRLGTTGDSMRHTRWSNTMAGEEYARIYSWGNDPKRKVSL